MDPQVAVNFLGPIGKAATAAEADVNELATTSFAVYNNLQIPVAELGKALDVMAASGKEGSFELKDMAREFPSITAQARTLGIVGVSGVARLGAALQVATLGASGPAEAATNLASFLKNLTSQKTIKRFQEEGLDLEKFLADSAKAAKSLGKEFDPIETVITEIDRVTKGNPFLIGRLFSDKQTMGFVNAASQNLHEYKRIREETGKADGVIQKDFDAMMTTTLEQWKKFRISLAATDIKPLTKGIQFLNDTLKATNDDASNASKVVNGIGAAILGGGTLIVLGQVTTALRSIGTALIFVSNSLKLAKLAALAFTNPLGLVITAATALGIGAAVMNKKREEEERAEEERTGVVNSFKGSAFAGMGGGGVPMLVPARPRITGAINKPGRMGDKQMIDARVTFENLPRNAKVKTSSTPGVGMEVEAGMAWD
jgi:TP901 family phage tail tape measure protein